MFTEEQELIPEMLTSTSVCDSCWVGKRNHQDTC